MTDRHVSPQQTRLEASSTEERIRVVAGLRKRLYELDHGEGIEHNVVKEEFAKWLSHGWLAPSHG